MATGTTTTTTTLSNNNPIVCNTFNHQQYLLLLCYPNNPTNIFTARARRTSSALRINVLLDRQHLIPVLENAHTTTYATKRPYILTHRY